jgi:hypothetical protein
VRYRYDPQRRRRLKTVEVIVAEREWEPPWTRFADDQIVALRVAFADVGIRERVKQAGGPGIRRERSGRYATIALWRSA